MRDLKILRQFWSDHQTEPLVLCTIVRKEGSGYRNLGAKKIVTKDGDTCGCLSGGCLEGEITRHALNNWEKVPFLYSFSTMNEVDRLLGFQTGCAGIIEILFERLPSASRMNEYFPYGEEKMTEGVLICLNNKKLGERKFIEDSIHEKNADSYFDKWQTPIHLFIIGRSPNTQPFNELALSLGWQITFLDYRKDYVLPKSQHVNSYVFEIANIGKAIPERKNIAVVLATHNYEADLQIMSQLNGKDFGYLGCIGPKKRFETMKPDLKRFYKVEMDDTWANAVKAPAGLHQGRSAENIAFSIVAEILFSIGAEDE